MTKDPLGEMRKLYAHFNLGEFDAYLPRLHAYIAGQKGYETNKYQLTPEQRATIRRRWGAEIERYGYADPESPHLSRVS